MRLLLLVSNITLMLNFATFPFCIAIVLVLQGSVCILDPAHFSQEVSSMLPKQVVLLHQDLGRTVNGYNIMAYGLTAIPGLPIKYELKDISYYPSTLIVSFMHGTDENAVNLLFGYVVNLMRMYEQDYYVQTVLKTGIVWLVPFLSIDTFELANQKHKDNIAAGKVGNQSKLVIKSIKNMNKFPDKSNQVTCDEKDSSKSTGVNLNYNFLRQKGAQFNEICNSHYAGPAPFSEKQTSALKKFMQALNINVAIDLQMGDDVWVYPSKKIWSSAHKYKFLYEDTIEKLKKSSIKLEQEQGEVIQEQKLGTPFTGGFINWAAAKGIFCFKYLITSEEKGERLQKSVSSSFSVLHMLVKKHAPIFNKYRSEDSSKLYIQPICAQEFTVRLEIVVEFGESATKEYVIPVGTVTEISLKLTEDSLTIPSLSHRGQPAYHLYILNTFIAQVIDLSTIPMVSELPPELLPVETERNKQVSYMQVGLIFLILGIAGAAVLWFVVCPSKHDHKTHRKMYDSQQEEATRL